MVKYHMKVFAFIIIVICFLLICFVIFIMLRERKKNKCTINEDTIGKKVKVMYNFKKHIILYDNK